MDVFREAFNRVKQDMNSIKNELDNLKQELRETRESMINICEIVKELSNEKNQTDRQIISTDRQINQTKNTFFKPLNTQNQGISIGNVGVPTDRQTDRQTDRHTIFPLKKEEKESKEGLPTDIDNALEILNSLDSIKKELRLKFKRLTEKEFLIFSTLYHLSEENGHSDYKTLSERLNLTESSIRDYIGKLINKGIPVDKLKINNKNIQLSISPNLKKIASLSTIMQLREI